MLRYVTLRYKIILFSVNFEKNNFLRKRFIKERKRVQGEGKGLGPLSAFEPKKLGRLRASLRSFEKEPKPKIGLTPFLPLSWPPPWSPCIVPSIFRFEILVGEKIWFAENADLKIGVGENLGCRYGGSFVWQIWESWSGHSSPEWWLVWLGIQ